MVHYKKSEFFEIEDVDIPIHILGVQPQAAVYCFCSLIMTLLVSIPMAPFSAILVALISRQFFQKEMAGRPLIYHQWILKVFSKYPFLLKAYTGLQNIKDNQEKYHGS